MAKQRGLSTDGKKHELTKRLVETLKLPLPEDLLSYNGEVNTIPDTISEIWKLSVFQLKEILNYHNVLTCGTKDELVLRLVIIKAERPHLALRKERDGLINLITIVRSVPDQLSEEAASV